MKHRYFMHIIGLIFILLQHNCVPTPAKEAPYDLMVTTAEASNSPRFEVQVDEVDTVKINGPAHVQPITVEDQRFVLDMQSLQSLLKPSHLLWMVWPWAHATYKLTPHIKSDCPELETGPVEAYRGGQRTKLQPKLGWRIERAFDDIDTEPVLLNCTQDAPDKRCLWWTNEDLVANVWSTHNPVYIDMYDHHGHKRCQLDLRLTLHLRDVTYD